MVLAQLIEKLDYEVRQGDVSVEIEGLTSDSRKVVNHGVFVAIVGAKSDGHYYLKNVIEKNAAAVIVQRGSKLPEDISENVTVIVTDNTRLALAYTAAAYYGYPAKKLFTIGITGTKGKTTTTYMIKNVLEACGIKTGLIGTIETIIGDESIPASNTTPESIKIHETFAKMVEKGIKAVVMEVSSQGLKLDRTAGIDFDIGVFTNLEPDHIGPGEHESFEDYLYCKSLLFKQCKIGIVNGDDRYTEQILKGAVCEVETYGLQSKCDLYASNIQLFHKDGKIGLDYHCSGLLDMPIHLNLPGEFSVYNSLCAIAVTRHFHVNVDTLTKVIQDVKVKGRVELVNVSNNFSVMIDYAHNAMSLKSILTTLKEYKPNRLICLFGCGGNRSKDRRYEMGKVAGELADFTIITSDNPRFEKPEMIIKDIESSLCKVTDSYITIIDRAKAIKYAIGFGKAGDIIVIAGKGHEDYQEIEGVKYPMDERTLVANAVKQLKDEGMQGLL